MTPSTKQEAERERQELERYFEIACIERRMWQERYEFVFKVLSHIHALAPKGQDIRLPDGRVFRFIDPNANETLRALGKAIHAIPDEIRATRAALPTAEPVAPWPDYLGQPIQHGARLLHPQDGAEFVAVRLSGNADESDAWRAIYADGTVSRLCLQIGDKGQAVLSSRATPSEPAPASESGAKLTKGEAKCIKRLALDLEKTGRIVALTEGQERADFVRKNREIQCALEDVLTSLTKPECAQQAGDALDAARYRWLRMQDWFDGPLCVVRNPKKALSGSGLGADCPSQSRLDGAIDAALALIPQQKEQGT